MPVTTRILRRPEVEAKNRLQARANIYFTDEGRKSFPRPLRLGRAPAVGWELRRNIDSGIADRLKRTAA